MKKNIFLLIFVGIFIGLGLTHGLYNKIFTNHDTNKYLLKWDLYNENKNKLNAIITSLQISETEKGIYKSEEVNVSDLTETEKVKIIYEYASEFDLIKDYSYITYDNFNEISYKIFGNTDYTFDEVHIEYGLYLKRNEQHKRYDLIETEESTKYSYIILTDEIKSAYQKEDMIYFDIPLTFARIDENLEISYSSDVEFNNIYCSKDCYDKLEYIVYRIYFKKDEKTDNYFLNKIIKLGSE